MEKDRKGIYTHYVDRGVGTNIIRFYSVFLSLLDVSKVISYLKCLGKNRIQCRKPCIN